MPVLLEDITGEATEEVTLEIGIDLIIIVTARSDARTLITEEEHSNSVQWAVVYDLNKGSTTKERRKLPIKGWRRA